MLPEEPPAKVTGPVPARSHRRLRPDHQPKPLSERQRAALLRNIAKAREVGRTLPRSPAQKAASLRAIQRAHESNRGRPLKLTPEHLAALRRNAAKATAARARRERTPEQLAKLRETIKLARAARTRKSFDLHNAKIIRHGMYARSVGDSMPALGENPKEFATHLRLLRSFLGPQDEQEEKIVEALAEAIRRRLRLWRAEAFWECRLLERCLNAAAPLRSPDPDLTLYRAHLLMGTLLNQDALFLRDRRLLAAIERVLRQLIHKRSGGLQDFIVYSRIRREPKSEDELEIKRMISNMRFRERLEEGGPEVEAALARIGKEYFHK